MSDFKVKMHTIRFPLALRLRLRLGSLQCCPRPLAVFKGPKSKGMEGKEVGKGRGKEGRGKGRKERERNLPDQCKTASYAPAFVFYTKLDCRSDNDRWSAVVDDTCGGRRQISASRSAHPLLQDSQLCVRQTDRQTGRQTVRQVVCSERAVLFL